MKNKNMILVVDDTPSNLQVLGDLLELEGHDVLLASSSYEGLEKARLSPAPDLILLDVMMPGMDGYEVCRQLKSDVDTKDIPVIFITGMSDKINEEKGLKLGAVDYIHKPFSLSLVSARVRNQLDLQSHRNHLTNLVEQRTAELAALNAELEQRVADEVEKSIQKDHLMFQHARLAAMGELLSHIAHQWRQPLNHLGLAIQSLPLDFEDGGLDGHKLKEFVDDTMGILGYLSRTIDDFRNFFAIEHSRTKFDPCQMTEKTIALIRTGFEQLGISVILVKQGSKPIMGYSDEFSQVVMNFLTNAKDILLERNVRKPMIEIRCYYEDGIDCISVRDNGGGIREEILDKIFDPYFTTKFSSQGAGIALYMAKMIIEKHMGGSCTAINAADGAEFIIKLPCPPLD
jgi:CheY-like chemotaxis protein